MTKTKILQVAVLPGLCLLSLARFSENSGYLTDIFSHFIFQYALTALLLMVFFIRKRNLFPAALAGTLFLINVISVITVGESTHASDAASKTFTVYSANINKNNGELSPLNREILDTYPEIVLLLEVRPGHLDQLRIIMSAYPYRLRDTSADSLGFILLSKFPVQGHNVTKLSPHGNVLVEALVVINQKPVMFYGIHAQRPAAGNNDERIDQFTLIARKIREQAVPVIIAGDFNETPYSPVFRNIVATAGLKDSREGFGWQPSWPTYFPPLWIPIDHILVTPDVQVHKRATGSYIGSDHYPVIAELSV